MDRLVNAPDESLEVVRVRGAGDSFAGAVEDPVVALIARLGELAREHSHQRGPRRVALVVETTSASPPLAASLFEAVRGVVGSATLELGPGFKVNAVVTEAGSEVDLEPTLSFLGGPDAGFVAGSTFDLRGAA
jgi:hypothetical protein